MVEWPRIAAIIYVSHVEYFGHGHFKGKLGPKLELQGCGTSHKNPDSGKKSKNK